MTAASHTTTNQPDDIGLAVELRAAIIEHFPDGYDQVDLGWELPLRREALAILDSLVARVVSSEDELQARAVLADQLANALRAVEWHGYSFIGLSPCPNCGQEKRHAAGCIVAAALAVFDAAAATPGDGT